MVVLVAGLSGCADEGAPGAAGDALGDVGDVGGDTATPPGDAAGDIGAGDVAGGDAAVDAVTDTAGSDADGIVDAGPDDAALEDSGGGDTVDDVGGGDALEDTGADAGGGDVVEDAGGGGDTDVTEPPPEVAHERWGARVWGQALGVTRIGRTIWFGTKGVPDIDSDVGAYRAGLGRLDIDTGDVRIFEEELPVVAYGPEAGELGPVATAGAVGDGDRVLVVAQTGLLIIEGDDVTFEPVMVDGGAVATPVAIAIDRDGGRSRLWVSTNKGLYLLDPDTLVEKAKLSALDIGGKEPGPLAVDPATGDLYAVVYDSALMTSVVARVTDKMTTTLAPGADGVPEGMVMDVAWSAAQGKAYIAIADYSPTTGGIVSWDGGVPAVVAVEGQLAEAARGEATSFGPARLAISDDDGMLIVGAALLGKPLAGIEGGGLAFIDLATGELSGLSQATADLPGDDVAALAYDPETRRVYAALRQACSEVKLGNRGLVAISFREDGSPRFERPILSGVRALLKVGDVVYAGLRDDNPGLACDGFSIQTGLVELRGNRSGELVPLHTVEGSPQEIVPFAGPVALDANGLEELAIGTRKDGLFFGAPDAGTSINQAIEVTVSLLLRAVAWEGDGVLWLGGTATHSAGDPPALLDKGPRGAARLVVDGGKVQSAMHFVLASDDPKDVTGLPSGDVAGILVDPEGGAILACAAERVSQGSLDRTEGPKLLVEGVPRDGGVARITAAGDVEVLAGPDAAPDPRALAYDTDGSLLVLDAEAGELRIDGGTTEPAGLALPMPEGAIPHGLLVLPDGAVAAHSEGIAVAALGEEGTIGGVGHAWEAVERADGVVLVGTDEGLVRLHAEGAVDVEEAPIAIGALPPFEKIDPPVGPGPDCLKAGALCGATPESCCAGLTCASGIALTCQ